MKATTSDAAWNCVVESIKEMLEDQGEEVEEVTPTQSIIGDLGIPSINLIHLMVALEDKLDEPLNYYKLATRDGTSVAKDITVGDLHEFVCESLNLR